MVKIDSAIEGRCLETSVSKLPKSRLFRQFSFTFREAGYTATWNISTKAPNPCEMPTISQRADHRSGVESLLEMNQFAE
jgi:hypothetical protein